MGILLFFWPLDVLFVILRIKRAPRLRAQAGGSVALWILDSPVSLVALALAFLLIGYYYAHPNVRLLRSVMAGTGAVVAVLALSAMLRGRRLHPYLVADGVALISAVGWGTQGGLLASAVALFLLQGYEYTLWNTLDLEPIQLSSLLAEETAGELYGTMDAAALFSVGMWWYLGHRDTLEGDVWLGVSFGLALLLTIGIQFLSWRVPPLVPFVSLQKRLVEATLGEAQADS